MVVSADVSQIFIFKILIDFNAVCIVHKVNLFEVCSQLSGFRFAYRIKKDNDINKN